MAENIVELLTDVADAIREKKGSTDKINAQNFADEIRSIESGGGSGFGNLNISGVVSDPTVWSIANIKTLRFNDGVTNINEPLKTFTGLEELYIPSSVNTIALGITTSCTNLVKIEVDTDNAIFDSRNDCNAIINAAKKSVVAGCKETTIPNGIIEIGYGAFQTQAIETITIPEGIEKIASYAFYGTTLTELEFPSTIKTISIYAFGACKYVKLYDFRKLTSIPQLGASQVFYAIPEDCKIVVPDALYDEWISATNWASFADKIIKASDYTE